ncbi:hypothetical protein COC45_30380, partial [Bacillus cereus]
APAAKTITVENNKTGTVDTIQVIGLAEGDIVKVYNVAKGGEAIATSPIGDGGTGVTFNEKDLLESTGGTVYVTVTKPNKDESSRTAVKYATEPVT